MGRLSVHCRCATRGSSDSRCAPVSSARRVVHDGHQPRPLQQNATTRDSAQSAQLTSTKPNLASPQVRKRSSFTRVGIVRDTSGHPRRKASCTTFSGALPRPSTASPTRPVYCPPLTFPPASVSLRVTRCHPGRLSQF